MCACRASSVSNVSKIPNVVSPARNAYQVTVPGSAAASSRPDSRNAASSPSLPGFASSSASTPNFSCAVIHQWCRPRPARAAPAGAALLLDHGVVVDSVNVSVFAYVPGRTPSLAPIACRNSSVTASLLMGPGYLSSPSGPALTGLNAVLVFAAFSARTVSACGSENAPLTRWPGAFAAVSATDSVASPAVEITLAVVCASYVFPTPGVNWPKLAAGPSVSDSVAGTLPPTVPFWLVEYVAGGGPDAGGGFVRARCRYVSASC